MGSIWLDGRTPGYPNLLDVLRAAGVSCSGYSGWEHRSRSSGGFNKLMVVYHHHTASSTTPQNDLNFMVNGSPDAPVSNGLLDRTGHFTAIAAGASNHAGKGGGSDSRPPWQSSKGQVPVDAGNSNGFGIECANAGTGEPYPQAQQDAYAKMSRALCDAYGMVPSMDLLSHWEWTARKCDPTGASRWAPPGDRQGCNGAPRWDMNLYRQEVAGQLPAPGPGPAGDDEMPKPFMSALIQCNGADGSVVGAVYVTDQIGMTYRYVDSPATLNDIQYALRVAGLSDAIQTVANRAAFGVLVGPDPGATKGAFVLEVPDE